MTHLGVELLEGVLAGEEVQVHVQYVRLRLTQQRRNSLHHVTCGPFFTFIIIVIITADPCWLQPVSAGGGRLGVTGPGSANRVLCGAKPLGPERRVAIVLLLLR